MANALEADLDLGFYARHAPWYPITSNLDLFSAWLYYFKLYDIDAAHREQLYYATDIDNFPVQIIFNCSEEELFFEQMGVDKWNSFCGRVDQGPQLYRVAFVAGSDLISIGAKLQPPPPGIDLDALKGPFRTSMVRSGARPPRDPE